MFISVLSNRSNRYYKAPASVGVLNLKSEATASLSFYSVGTWFIETPPLPPTLRAVGAFAWHRTTRPSRP